MRAVTSLNLLLFIWSGVSPKARGFIGFAQIVVDRFSNYRGWQRFISIDGYTWKLSCSLTLFHNVLALLLSSSCD